MTAVFDIILPVFGLVGLGYLAVAVGLLSEKVGDGLSDFVFIVAVPALLFRTLATGEVPDQAPWGYWFAYFSGVAIVWLVAMVIVVRVFRRDMRTGVVAGFTTGQANTVLIGIPLILTTFGTEASAPMFLLIAIHLPIMMAVATILIEVTGTERRPPLMLLQALAVAILKNPIIIAILAGGAYGLAGLPLPGFADALTEKLGQAAVPCALFSMGMALRRYGFVGDLRITAAVAVLRLIVHPGIFYLLAVYVVDLPPLWVGVGVLFASAPCGVNGFLVASRYGTGIRISASSIALTTALAVITSAIWLQIVGPG